jgi:uncharacterized protein YndB with AHSA1/START domain
MTAKHEFVFRRVLNAPRDRVFKAWTDPRQLALWWGPDGFTNPRCELDARPGGAIHIDMRAPDGTVYPMTGVFREIVEPEKLVLTAAVPDGHGGVVLEDVNTVTFSEKGGKTTVVVNAKVIRAAPEAEPMIAGMEEGWTQSLVRLARVAESGAL